MAEGVLDHRSAAVFAEHWYAAWNAHDVEAVMSHYRADIVFTSPFAVHGDAAKTMHGHDEVTRHVRRAFARVPDLQFEPLDLLVAPTSVVLHYRGVLGLLVAEYMELDGDERVSRVVAHYSEPGG